MEVAQKHDGRNTELPHKLPEVTLGVGHWRLSSNEGLWSVYLNKLIDNVCGNMCRILHWCKNSRIARNTDTQLHLIFMSAGDNTVIALDHACAVVES